MVGWVGIGCLALPSLSIVCALHYSQRSAAEKDCIYAAAMEGPRPNPTPTHPLTFKRLSCCVCCVRCAAQELAAEEDRIYAAIMERAGQQAEEAQSAFRERKRQELLQVCVCVWAGVFVCVLGGVGWGDDVKFLLLWVGVPGAQAPGAAAGGWLLRVKCFVDVVCVC